MTVCGSEGAAPLVSVIMTVFNNAPFVHAAVSSVLQQSMGDLEIVLIDDGSHDRTIEVCRALAAKDRRIRFEARANGGGCGAGAHNYAMDITRGAFIAHLDGDDLWHPDKLKEQMPYLLATDGYPCTFTHAEFIDEEGGPAQSTSPECFKGNYGGRSLAIRLLMGNFICHSTAIYSRHQMNQTGRFSLEYARVSDFDYWLRVMARSTAVVLPFNTVSYRVHGQNYSLTDQAAAAAQSLHVSMRHWAAIHRRYRLTPGEQLSVLDAMAQTACRGHKWEACRRLMRSCEQISPGWFYHSPMWDLCQQAPDQPFLAKAEPTSVEAGASAT